MSVTARRALRTGCVVLLALLSGCGFGGLNDRPLPFAAGNGDGAMTVTVVMDNAANLVPNSEVKVGDVTVGSVRRITFRNWHAVLEVGLVKGTVLPANATARIGQKSLLGAEYLELAKPSQTAAAGRLRSGATIPLSRTGRYPETEEVFAALSTVLNGGGLAQAQTITTELNRTLHGREGDVRDLLGQLGTLVGTLDGQRGHILATLRQLNRTTTTINAQQGTVDRALTTLPKAVDLLGKDEDKLADLLDGMQRFSDAATKLESATRADLAANLRDLQPVLNRLSDAGKALTGFLGDATFPFPTDGLLKSVRGDYMNLFLTVDVSVPALSRDWLTGTPLDGVLNGLGGLKSSPTSGSAVNPLDLGGLLSSAQSLAAGTPSKRRATNGDKPTRGGR